MRNKRPDGKETHDEKIEVNGVESLVKEKNLPLGLHSTSVSSRTPERKVIVTAFVLRQ